MMNHMCGFMDAARRLFHQHGLPTIGTVLACAALAAGCAGTRHAAPATAVASDSTDSILATPEVRGFLESACYGCHSTQSNIPWYGTLAPSSWFRGGARKALNFSDWQTYDAARRAAGLRSIAEVVKTGEMPPWDYVLFNSSARLDDSQQQVVVQWAAAQSAH